MLCIAFRAAGRGIRDAAMSTGASGYVLKTNASRDVLDALGAAVGEHYAVATLASS